MSEQKGLVNYEELLAKMAKKATATEKPSSSSVTAKAGILAYNGTPVPQNKLDVIIIASSHANLYYEDKYDPNDIKNPVCYAYAEDPDEEEMKPHPKSSKPQSENCDDCPMNQWGSDPSGGRGKACKNTRKLAIVPADVTPEDIMTAEVATMALPVMTVSKQWSPYVHKLATLYGRPPLAMVTQIGTKPDQKAQFMITFDDLRPVDISLLEGIMSKHDTAITMLQKEYEPNKEEEEGATPRKPRGKAKF